MNPPDVHGQSTRSILNSRIRLGEDKFWAERHSYDRLGGRAPRLEQARELSAAAVSYNLTNNSSLGINRFSFFLIQKERILTLNTDLYETGNLEASSM